jgi:hypothetical protein
MFFDSATEEDFEIKNQLDALIDKALDDPPPGVTGLHLGMTLVDMARCVIEAQIAHEQENTLVQ